MRFGRISGYKFFVSLNTLGHVYYLIHWRISTAVGRSSVLVVLIVSAVFKKPSVESLSRLIFRHAVTESQI